MYIGVESSVATREFVAGLLGHVRHGRGEPIQLSTEPLEGFHYAYISHEGVREALKAILQEMAIGFIEVDSIPGKSFAPVQDNLTTYPSDASHRPGPWSPTDDPRVREAMVGYLVDLFQPRGSSRFGL